MKIVVLVKHVPDMHVGWKFTPKNTVLRNGGGLDQADEYALEAALNIRKDFPDRDISILALTLGDIDAELSLRKALQFGADSAYHVLVNEVAGSDVLGTSLILSKVLQHIGSVNLVITSSSSSDGGTGVVPVQIAQHLGWAFLGAAENLLLEGNNISIRQYDGNNYQKLSASIPAVISVTDAINQPHYPGFKDLLEAKKKNIYTISLDSLDLDSSQIGFFGSMVETVEIVAKEERVGSGVIVTGKKGIPRLVDFLADRNLL